MQNSVSLKEELGRPVDNVLYFNVKGVSFHNIWYWFELSNFNLWDNHEDSL